MKKLFLILFLLPILMIGQNTKLDAIIFVNGDTIYGNIIEVGTEEITYTYRGESIKNKTRISVLAKIDFASGRKQNFKGLDTFNRRIERDIYTLTSKQKHDNKKRIKHDKKKKRKEKGIKNNWHIRIGVNLLTPIKQKFKSEFYTQNYPTEEDLTTLLGFNTEISYLYNFNQKHGYLSSLSYTNVIYKSNSVLFEKKVKYNSINLTQQYCYHLNPKTSLLFGISFDKPILIIEKGIRKNTSEGTILNQNSDPIINQEFNFNMSEFDKHTHLRSFLSFVISTKYSIIKIKNHSIFVFTNLKLPFYFDREKSNLKNSDTTELYKELNRREFQNNRYITIGFGITL
jgi:hypothetical protein